MAFPHKRGKVAGVIARGFAEGRWKIGDRFPSDTELALELEVTHVTVRAALKPLVEAGVLERRVGIGTMVRQAGPEVVRLLSPQEASQTGAPSLPLSGTVGVVIPANTNSFFSEILRAIESELFARGMPMLLAHHWEIGEREEAVIRSWQALGVTRVIAAPILGRAAFYNGLIDEGVRLAFVDRLAGDVDAPSVSSDDRPAAARATQFLWDLGHRDIVHFAGPLVASTAVERRDGFLDTCHGLGIADPRVIPAGFFIEDGYRVMTQWLKDGHALPHAIVCTNDGCAVGTLRALAEHGLDCPRDVSVVGYSDSDLARNFNLTTVRQFPERMGTEAVRLLLSEQRLGRAGSLRLPAELIIRGSTAARMG